MTAGCKLDEAGFPKDALTSGTITGTWFIKKQTTSGTVLGIAFPATTTTDFTATDYYRFNTDKSVVFSQSNPTTVTSGTYIYTKNGTTHTLFVDNPGADASFDNSFTIAKLTTDSLVLTTTVSVPALSTETNITLRLARK